MRRFIERVLCPVIFALLMIAVTSLSIEELQSFDDFCYSWEEGFVDGYCSNARWQDFCNPVVPVCYGFNLFKSERQAYQMGYRDGERRWKELH